MKKLFILLIGLLLVQNSGFTRDYTKIQMKEMKHAQKYGTTQIRTQNFNSTINVPITNTGLRDPHILILGDYKIIDDTQYKTRLSEDEKQYEEYRKQLKKVNLSNYNAQAKGGDYYRIYRIAEKIIRANRLDYQPWRFGVTRESDEINAYSNNGNYINLYTSLIDSLSDNDDALAITIGHEIAHILLGHQKRKMPTIIRMQRMRRLMLTGNVQASVSYSILKRKLMTDSKNMEYAADIEGAKLAAKAGYNMDKATDLLTLFETFDTKHDYYSDHPSPDKRIESFNQNVRLFPLKAWSDWGKYNICNTPVLNVSASSDRSSIIISAPVDRTNTKQYYHTETQEEMLLRFGYMSYLNSDFAKSIDYFEKYFSLNNTNAPAYLYASYAAEEEYKRTNNNNYLKKAKQFIEQAQKIDSTNKYIREQAEALK